MSKKGFFVLFFLQYTNAHYVYIYLNCATCLVFLNFTPLPLPSHSASSWDIWRSQIWRSCNGCSQANSNGAVHIHTAEAFPLGWMPTRSPESNHRHSLLCLTIHSLQATKTQLDSSVLIEKLMRNTCPGWDEKLLPAGKQHAVITQVWGWWRDGLALVSHARDCLLVQKSGECLPDSHSCSFMQSVNLQMLWIWSISLVFGPEILKCGAQNDIWTNNENKSWNFKKIFSMNQVDKLSSC